jgi:glyoxylase-like metal-dependent hydrolase (beta-lactamase superfamily II)
MTTTHPRSLLSLGLLSLACACASDKATEKTPDPAPTTSAALDATRATPPAGIGKTDDAAVLGPFAIDAPLQIQGYKSSEANGTVNSWLLMTGDEAALIDAQLVLSEGAKVAEMIKQTGKTLKWIWVTHGHPDHSMGLQRIVEAFPDAKVYAHPRVATEAQKLFAAYQKPLNRFFPGDIPDQAVTPTAWDKDELELGGTRIKILVFEDGETEFTTALHIPTMKALFPADMVYHRVFPWLNEMRVDGVRAHVDAIEALPDVDTLYPGHGEPVGKEYFTTYREYLDLFEAEVPKAKDADDLVARVWSQRRDWRSLAGLRFSASAHIKARK